MQVRNLWEWYKGASPLTQRKVRVLIWLAVGLILLFWPGAGPALAVIYSFATLIYLVAVYTPSW